MHAVEHTFAMHVEYRQRELLRAAEVARQSAAVAADPAHTNLTSPAKRTRQHAAWSWPSLRARRQATA